MKPIFRYLELLFMVVIFGGSVFLISSCLVTCINRENSQSLDASRLEHVSQPAIKRIPPSVEIVFHDDVYLASSYDEDRIYFYALGWQDQEWLYALNRITGNFERPSPLTKDLTSLFSWMEVSPDTPQCCIGDSVLMGDRSYKISRLTNDPLIGVFSAEVGNFMRQIQWNCLTGALHIILPDGSLQAQGYSLNYK